METLKQISLFVENRSGALAEIIALLSNAGINIRTLSLADTQQFGILRLLVDDTVLAAETLKKAGIAIKVTDVIGLNVSDKVGGLSAVLNILARHRLSVEYMYAFTSGKDGQAALVFRFSDVAAAQKALAEESL